MEFKPQIESLLKTLKNKGVERAKIEEDLGYSENYIDQMLAKGGNKRFLTALQKYVLQKTTPVPPNGQQAAADPLTGAHVTLQDYINLLKDYNEKLFALLSSNLGNLQEGQRIMIAYQKAWVDHAAELESKGDPDKKEDLKYRFGKLVDDILSGAVVSGIQTGTGKRSKA